MVKKFRDYCIGEVLKVEGGYVNDPTDSGGETNFGITVKVARENGYTGPMRDLPIEKAIEIYRVRYWDVLRLDDISALGLTDTAEELLESGVNHGTGRAGRFLQEALNAFNRNETDYSDIGVDGVVGSGTIKAVKGLVAKRGAKLSDSILSAAANCLQGAFYLSLAKKRPKDEKYVVGWFDHRIVVKDSN